MPTIRLIVGLGNPGKEHEGDRHNAGVWLVERLADFVHPLPALARFALGDVDVQAMPR